MNEYDKKLNDFVQLLTEEQKKIAPDAYAHLKSGRKYDRVFITMGGCTSVRYFVDRSDGAIYGARSLLAPNLKHWFGTIESPEEWHWSDFHPTPKNPDNFIFVGRYGPYNRYAKKG